MAAWIKMPLGTEVGLSPGDFVLGADPAPAVRAAPSPKMGGAPSFRPTSIVAKRLHGSIWHLPRIGLGLRDIVLDGDPATPRKKDTPTPPSFWPISILAKRMDR